MPRRRRGLRDHCCYHVTHRCHKREFLFKFARDREVYVELLRETVKRFKIDVLNYVVTSNHVHLLLWVRKGKELSRAMQFPWGWGLTS
jgi:putative transposase